MNTSTDAPSSPQPSRARRAAIGAAKGLTLVWFVVHFGLTVIHVMPINPIKNEVGHVADMMLAPVFTQNWSLFAPTPIQTNYSLLVRPLTDSETVAYEATGALPGEGWYDLSSPLWARFQTNRFSAYDRLSRVHSAAIRQYISGGIDLVAIGKACQKGDAEACEVLADSRGDRKDVSGGVLARTASSFCQDLAASGRPCGSRAALRIRIVGSVPWSERYTGTPDTVDVDVDVFDVDPAAAPMNVFAFPPRPRDAFAGDLADLSR